MKKKQVCLMIAALVSICCVVSVVTTATGVVAAVRAGTSIPSGLVMLSLITAFCTVVIWRSVRGMED